MIAFKFLTLKLKLTDSNGQDIPNVPVYFQCYNYTTKVWVTLYAETLSIKGLLNVRKTVLGAPTSEATFFDAVKNDKMPPIRIIPAEGYEDLEKQPVLGSTFSFYLNEATETFEIDFGTVYKVPDELISDSRSPFKDTVPVTSFFRTFIPVENTAVPVNQLYTDIVSEIATAATASETSAFKLSNISLKLKALVHNDGETVSASLLDFANSENVNGNAISELVFDITPTQTGEAILNLMPDVTGLTETAVRRVLQSLHLKLSPVYQNNENVVNGDSFKQLPAAGDRIQPNQTITVIFSKHE